jgi:EAL domain-containing protein (putative c-di-GMP-specific phosphodiesterase class I)
VSFPSFGQAPRWPALFKLPESPFARVRWVFLLLALEVEALARWQHPQRGLLAPSVFIPIAEETGLIVSIGQWVLAEARRQIQAWQVRFPKAPPLVVSVNLSGRQFQHASLVADVERTLRQTGIEHHSLKLEITETVLMRDVEAAITTCNA